MHRFLCLWVVMIVARVSAAPIEGFNHADFLNEQERTWTSDNGVRVLLNAPGDFDPVKPTTLVFFTTPNGNSVEQTLGAKLEPGMDWHYDIQHIGAQIRKLRQLDKSRNLVVAVAENEKRSWPAWRGAHADNGKPIREIVDSITKQIPGNPTHVVLAGHSGGGSFIFGYLNGGEKIGANVDRIIWLDADYAYDEEQDHHGTKLLAWLKSDARRHLVVIAYDDRFITLNGKPVLKNPLGGTYGSTHRMIDRLEKDLKLAKSSRGPFEEFVGMNGQVHFLIHTNAEKKILHTILVERNGLIEAMTFGTPLEGTWGGEFWGDRAYTDLIAPLVRPATQTATSRPTATTKSAGIPPRPANAMSGKTFADSIADLPPRAREAAIVQEITKGNIPNFERQFHAIKVSIKGHDYVYQVLPDYLAIGSDDDFVRMPMTPISAQQIADAFGCSMPTRKMVNDIYAQAELKLEPQPLSDQREAVRTFVQHNDLIEHQRAGKKLGLLVAGDKKDVVISNKLKEKPNKVAIYGWHKLDGKPIQPLYTGHGDFYADYSHGIRLVKREVMVDGKPRDIEDVLKDPILSILLSDEGVIEPGAAMYESGH